jgi:hypothetical protein
LIFAPGGDSKLRAYDSNSGKLMWTSPALDGTIRGGHSMYQIGGRQYVLVAVRRHASGGPMTEAGGSHAANRLHRLRAAGSAIATMVWTPPGSDAT